MFDKWIRKTNREGLVLFIPDNPEDLSSPANFVKEVAKKVRVGIRIVQGSHDEWEKYNLQPYVCHPSAFGAGMIAREIASWVSTLPLGEQGELSPLSHPAMSRVRG